MTAEIFTAVVRDPSTFSLEKKNRGSAPLGAAGVAAWCPHRNLYRCRSLDALSAVTKADYVVAANQSGRASSVLK